MFCCDAFVGAVPLQAPSRDGIASSRAHQKREMEVLKKKKMKENLEFLAALLPTATIEFGCVFPTDFNFDGKLISLRLELCGSCSVLSLVKHHGPLQE